MILRNHLSNSETCHTAATIIPTVVHRTVVFQSLVKIELSIRAIFQKSRGCPKSSRKVGDRIHSYGLSTIFRRMSWFITKIEHHKHLCANISISNRVYDPRKKSDPWNVEIERFTCNSNPFRPRTLKDLARSLKVGSWGRNRVGICTENWLDSSSGVWRECKPPGALETV